MNTCGGWDAVRERVRQRVGVRAFEAWFEGLHGTLDDQTLVIDCPDAFVRDWIKGRYGEVLEAAAPGVRSIRYRAVGGSSAPRPGPAVASRAVDRPAHARPTLAEGCEPESRAPLQGTFSSFVAGPTNALALEAARAVARGEAGRCNPLVIAGPAGVGKTHLCTAIRQEAGEGVVYRSSEEFTSEVTQGIRSDRMPSVRHRYRRAANLLILEDVQFLRGRRATQTELFHTLDHLLARGRSVVVTSDRPPQEIEQLDPSLASRLASGLVAYIGPPELETRYAILRDKAAAGGVRVPEACIELLGTRAIESVRDLLAGLNQVVARSTLLKRPITTELVEEALATVSVPGRRRSLGEIIAGVARAYSLEVSDLRSRSRKRRVTRPRQLAMYLCRRYTDASLKEIGRALARDHSSVLYAIDVVEKRTLEEPQLRYELETLIAKLGS